MSSPALPVGLPRYSQSGADCGSSKAVSGSGIEAPVVARCLAKRVRDGTGRAKVDLAEIVPLWAKVLDVAAFDVDTFCVATLAVDLGPDPAIVCCVAQPASAAAQMATRNRLPTRTHPKRRYPSRRLAKRNGIATTPAFHLRATRYTNTLLTPTTTLNSQY